MARHNDTGKNGETAAAIYLQKKGYTILELGYRAGRAEIDIIAKIGNDIVFVEVKTRSTVFFGLPEEFVTKTKQKLIQKAADAYLLKNNIVEESARFDIISVLKGEIEDEIYHMEDAFWPDSLEL
ncbi:MAG: YraN family protein [Bacteroidia bacterium]|nr:YraN family protein [Bacteroidia bacterium]